MTYAILNIGLHTNTGSVISADTALDALRTRGIEITTHAVHTSDTEPTLVVAVNIFDLFVKRTVVRLCEELGQDAIAVWFPRPVAVAGRIDWSKSPGLLFGPKAEEWGPFNPEFFLQLDGRRLSAWLKGAA